MAENLGGISEDVSALIRAINAALPQSNTKKTVDIKVNGTKELKEAADSVKTFGAAVKTLDESGVDRVTKSVGSIMGLLSGKLKNAPVSSITTSLIEVFTKPDASAKQLLDTVLQVQSQLENVQRLSKKIDVSLLTSSQLDSLLSRQSKIDELQYEFSSNKGSDGRKDPRKYVLRREAYQKYEDIDVYQMARKAKSGKRQTAKEIAENIGIDPNTVTSADAEQLQTYIRTLDLLKQLIDARKEYGEIHTSADANDYLKQEQQISKVYQEVLKQEAAIRSKFKVKEDPLSAAFGLNEQTVKQNAQQAAEAYVNWFMRTLQTQLNAALADLDTRVAQLQGNIEERTERSAQRVEKNTKFARGRGNGGAGGGSGSGTGGIGDGTGEAGSGRTESVGDTTAAGMEQVAEATEVAIDKIKQYLVTEEESIAKIKKLFKEIDDLYTKQVSATSDKEKNAIDLQIRDKLLEASKYRANLQRLGWPTDKEQMNEKLSKSVPEKLSSFAFDIDDAVRGSSQLLKENRQLIQSIRDYKYEVATIPEAQSNGMSSAIDGIKEYLLSIEECINKIKELQDTKLDYSMDSEEYKGYVKEQALYFARLQKLGVSQDRIIDEIGIADYNELSDAVTKIQTGDFGDDIKVKYDAILSYVDSNPVTVKVETDEAKKKVDEIKKTINELAEQSKTVEFGAVFDSRTGKSSKTYSGKDKQIDLAEAYTDAKKSGIQADTYFHTHPDAAKYAAFSLKDIETSIEAVKDGIRQSVLMVGDEVATMDVSSLAGLGQDFLKQFYASISTNVKNGLKQLRDNIAQSLSYGDVIDDLPMLTKQLQDDLKEVLEGEISEGRLSQQDADIIQPVINAAIDQVQQKLLEMIKSGEKLQGYTLINDSIQSIIDQVERSIASSDIKIDPSVLNAIITDAFTGLDDVFDQEKFKKMFDKDNFPLDKMAQIQQKAISDAFLQLGKEPEDFYKILTKDQFLGQVYNGENPKSKLHIDVSEAVNEINALKEVVASLKEQILQLSETKVVVDVDELQSKLERAQEEIDELNHALAGTVSESSNTFLSEQLSEAEQRVRELSEEVESLRQQLTDAQQKAQQAPLDMGVLDKKVAELQYLYDKVRTIFDGKDGIINEDMTYDEKFNSAEVQRMIELLSQLTDAELKAAGVMPDDEGSYDSFRQQLQERISLIKEAQDEIQKVIDGQSDEDRTELDLNIARQLEEIYSMAEEVGVKFESRLTPAVREFLSLIEGHVGADEMSNFLGQQNIDRYVDDIISGTKTAKEAFADLENSFGWDTERFESLIDGEVPQELKGLYDRLFSDVEKRIKSAEQAADEFNSKLREMQAHETPVSSDTSALPEQERAAGEAAAAAAENMKNQAAAVREAEDNYNRLNNAVQQYIENQNKVNTGNYKIVHTQNPKDRGRISDMVNYTDIRSGRTTKASIKKILNEYINNKKELDTGYLRGLTDEESFKLSDDDLRFRASNADRILDKLSAYVYSYQNMEEAAKLFGNANSEVFDEVQRRIENAKIANEAFEASFTKSDNVRYALSKYGIDKMTIGQLSQLESAMETGGFEAFAAKVKELFGVEIPSSIEEAREAINNLNAESQSLDPSQDRETSSQKRGQENETEVQSVEQLIAEYERLGSVLSTIETRHKGNVPIGEEKNRWDEASKAQKEVADKLRESGMYYSPDQGKWVEDVVNLEDKYKELLSLIESGDTKAIADMFKIDEASLGSLETLKNNLKLVIDTLNAADGMSASGAKLSWWDGWLGGGRDLFNTDELTGALKTLGISDDIIEQVAQAHRDAAEAAKQHAAEEQAAADATKNVVDAAGAQKVPGREQPSINPENTGETADMTALGEAVKGVASAVDEKTMAFAREAQIVQESVQIELASLQRLVQQLEAIRDLSQNLPKIQLTGKDGTKANPIVSPELIQSIEQLKTTIGDFDPQKLTELFASIKSLRINENVSGRMTELATGFTDLRNALDGWEGNAARTLEMITQLVQKANALKDVIKTANEQNVKQPKAEKAPAKKEPEKPAQKSQDEIRADQLKAYNAALKEYQSLEKTRVQNGQKVDDLGAETLAKRVSLAAQLDSIEKSWNDAAAQGVAKTKEMLDLEQERKVNAEEIAAAESKRWNEQVKRNINFSNLQSRTAKLKAEKDLRPEAFGQRYEEIEKMAHELSLLFPLKPFDEKAAEDARKMAEELDKMITETRSAPEYKLAKDNYVSNLGRKMETWAANNKRAVDANFGAWENMQQEFKQINTLEEAQNVSKMFDEFVAGANRAGQAGETFAQGLMKRFKSLGQYLLSFASFYRIIGVFKQAFNTVKQLDDALTEMRKVSDESLSSLQKYQSLSFNMADEVGTTAQQIQQSTADWLRLGESFEEAQKSARESTILLNVSEFENIDKATEALVSASQAYKNLDKIDIIDKLNNIGNNFSISTDQLATGLQNAAAVLMTQGNDIDEALALLTAGNAITQDISKTSAGITYARTYSNIRVLKTRKQLYRSKTRDGSDRAKALRIIYKYMDKYYNVSSVRMMRFLYSLGFDNNLKPHQQTIIPYQDRKMHKASVA